MYSIDTRQLKMLIGVSLFPSINKEENLTDRINYYYPIVLDMIIGGLNSEHQRLLEIVDEQMDRYPDDINIIALHYLIADELRVIKKQFILAGFDPRVKYKLDTRNVGNTTLKKTAILMDLEATVANFPSTVIADKENAGELITSEPTLEQLNQFFTL